MRLQPDADRLFRQSAPNFTPHKFSGARKEPETTRQAKPTETFSGPVVTVPPEYDTPEQ